MKKIIIAVSLLFSVLLVIIASNAKEGLVNIKNSFLQEEKISSKTLDLKAGKDDMLQLRSGGHILGFKSTEMYIASATHMLKIEFSGSNKIKPISDSKNKNGKEAKVAELSRVRYDNLWNNVDLVYDKTKSGVFKSTYYVAPSKDSKNLVDQIRLKYNVPVDIEKSGNLLFSFETGQLKESKPVAWQDIDGKRVMVNIEYKMIGDKEIGFKVDNYDPEYELVIDPVLEWNTFLGSYSSDTGNGISIDGSENIYITGRSGATWGSPVNAHAGGSDAFVAKLNSSGVLQWHTFLGSSNHDYGRGISIDGSGNIYITGNSSVSWGSPVNTHAGGSDAFAAKLNSSGVLQWHTFLGSSDDDDGIGISIDGSENIYIIGESYASWGSPVNAHAGSSDAFAAKLNSSGVLQWHTFLGSSNRDHGNGISIDGSGDIYITGNSYASWGSPVNAHAGGSDAFAAKLNSSGVLQWHRFLGSSNYDDGIGISIDGSGDIYITGYSSASWGSPVNAHAGGTDAFAAKLNSSGVLQWHTFLGSSNMDIGIGISIDGSGNIYITGRSAASWGSPVNAHAEGYDAFAAKLNSSGVLQWHTFLGSSMDDYGNGISIDGSGNIYITGYSYASWGSPVNAYAGSSDVFVAKITNKPLVTTMAATGINTTGATLNGTVNAAGSFTSVTFEYGLTDSYGLTIDADPSTASGNSTINISRVISDLTPYTLYHFRAVGQNTHGADYGVDMTFTTGETIPAVITNSVSNISFTSAVSGGNVTDSGSSNVTARGVCWSTSPDPSISDTLTTDGTGEGSFLSSITGLNSGTTYYVRAYATNSVGTGYGSNETFTTSSVSAPSAVTNTASGVYSTGAVLNGTINANNQSTTVTFEYGTTTGYGTTVSAAPGTVTGTSDTSVNASLSGLLSGIVYHYRVIALNASGTSYGADMTFNTGGTAPAVTTNTPSGVSTTGGTLNGTVNANNQSTTVTFEYGTTTGYGISIAASPGTVTGISDTSVSANLSGLLANTTYHYRAVGENVTGTTYGADMIFTTGGGAIPEVRTKEVSNIITNSVQSGGVVTSSGGSAVISRGVCWSLSTNPTLNSFHTNDGSGIGSFISNITGLIPGQTYYIRAYARNTFGTAYGQNVIFTSLKDMPDIKITNPDNGEIVSDIVNIKAITSRAVNSFEFYIDDTLIEQAGANPEKDIASFTGMDFYGVRVIKRTMNKTSFTEYSTYWNTLDYNDGIHKIKVMAVDSENRTITDQIEVMVRNIKITLNAIRKEANAYSFKTYIGELTFIVENKKNQIIAYYEIHRKISGGQFESISEIDSSELLDNTYTYYDKNIDKDTSYTYKVIAYDSSGNILSESELKSI